VHLVVCCRVPSRAQEMHTFDLVKVERPHSHPPLSTSLEISLGPGVLSQDTGTEEAERSGFSPRTERGMSQFLDSRLTTR